MANNFFVCAVLCVYALIFTLPHGNQSGFISIDCGISAGSSYSDATTSLRYESDSKYIDSGISIGMSSKYHGPDLKRQFMNVRSFPEGLRNCYAITPPRATVSATYLIRASFFYGDYDGKSQVPEFDIHLGVNKWDSVSFSSISAVVTKEIIHVISSKIIHTCLLNTGSGTPFISSLEIRPFERSIYLPSSASVSLLLFKRLSFGSTSKEIIRYKDDIYDRIWEPLHLDGKNISSGTLGIDNNRFDIPSIVIGKAVTPLNDDESLEFYWNFASYSSNFIIYLHFAELHPIPFNQSRKFNIFLDGHLFYASFSPVYLTTSTIYKISPVIKEWLNISISKSTNSTLPPIISAMEIYTKKEFLQPQTDEKDVGAIMNIKSLYGVKSNWQGDPCAPKEFKWDGVKCNYSVSTSPRIIYLDLSSRGLSGEISPYLSNLTLLQYLDLSNNNLTGTVPKFLAQLSFLSVIKLSKNNLTGPLPDELLEKSSKGLLSVSMDAITIPCTFVPCKNKNNKKVVAVLASLAAFVVVLIVLAALWKYKSVSRKGQVIKSAMKTNLKGRLSDAGNRQFTYSEILSITNNLETVIGKGGFGPVYHGCLEETEVAVKMLSSSSAQGYKEFRAEVQFLTRVHHINLTTLVGYCDEGDNIGLIYEYMSNGNLKEHLLDRQPTVLSWEERLHIAMDAATGLEYLHHGCKPPIIHRDVKSANILLDQKFRAKLADFGLSRDFPVDNTHVSTVLAGTPGYLDPEYYVSYKLTEKSDVFSFGVVLLEIITSRPVLTRDEENAHIIQHVRFMISEDKSKIIDPRLGGEFEENSLQRVVDIAMACTSPTSVLRPSMKQVVTELNKCISLEMTRINGSRGTEINYMCSNGNPGTEIQVVSLNYDSEMSLVGR